mgnify:CR=1 FL=1|tara:strand:- start:140 stop:304 length:165 start_codon:yes stop_codon:yes gene_type:complete
MAEILQTVSQNTNPDKFKKSTIRKYDWVSLFSDDFYMDIKRKMMVFGMEKNMKM